MLHVNSNDESDFEERQRGYYNWTQGIKKKALKTRHLQKTKGRLAAKEANASFLKYFKGGKEGGGEARALARGGCMIFPVRSSNHQKVEG